MSIKTENDFTSNFLRTFFDRGEKDDFLDKVMHFTILPLFLAGWGKNMMIYQEKKTSFKGKRWKNGGKGKIVTLLKNISFLKKRGVGQKYYIWKIYTPEYMNMDG